MILIRPLPFFLTASLIFSCHTQQLPSFDELPIELPNIPHSQNASSTPGEASTFDQPCVRDVNYPAPVAGSSQFRYAMSVVASAVMIALASKLYHRLFRWKCGDDKGVWHLLVIILARIFVIIASKLSAALVASISNTENDGALDASDAFITWGTSIILRVYYEGFELLYFTIALKEHRPEWLGLLKTYMPVSRSTHDVETGRLQEVSDKKPSAVGEESHPRHLRMFNAALLIVHSMLFIATDMTILVLNFVGFIKKYSGEVRLPFKPSEDAGQCGIMSSDYGSKFNSAHVNADLY